MRSPTSRLACILIVPGLLAALMVAYVRIRVESRFRSVAIVLDYAEVERLAVGVRRPVPEVLRQLKEAGATGVAVTEATLEDLMATGVASVTRMDRFTTVRLTSPGALERLADAWERRGVPRIDAPGPDAEPCTILWCPQASGKTAVFKAPIGALRTMGAGLPDEAVEAVRNADLDLVARIANYPGVTRATLERVLKGIRAQGARVVVCTGTEVFGSYGAHEEAAEALHASGMLFGQIEFGKQKGADALGRALRGEFVRVHSISEGEMGTLSEAEVVERFVRAVRERNIRLCYVRLLTFAGSQTLNANMRCVSAIRKGIVDRSLLKTGSPDVLPPFDGPVWALVLMGLGSGALGGITLRLFVPGARCCEGAWTIVPAVLFAVLAASGELGRKLTALGVALSAPTLAMWTLLALIDSEDPDAPATGLFPRVLSHLLKASAITLLGAALVSGLLAGRTYMMKTDQFLGIKLAHAVPMLVAAWVLAVGLPKTDDAATAWRTMVDRLRRLTQEPVRTAAFVVTLLILAAAGLALMRTGNEPGVGVSGLELKFRALLDTVLPVRPRTKEFLIGHPAFVLAAGLALLGRRRWLAPLVVLGALGQASLLNTFCHIHTALTVSVLRAGVGLILGAVVGWLLLAVWLRITPRGNAADRAAP